MTKIQDISGQRFGNLLCIHQTGKGKWGEILYLCQCACGQKCLAAKSDLTQGKKKSCGCGQGKKSHGLSRENGKQTLLHRVWMSMLHRCNNPKSQSYKYYGHKGISVCDEWDSYENFYKWAIQNGYRKGLTIERIDNDGDYCLENCKWIPQSEQARNSKGVRFLTYKGQTKTYGEWEKVYGINRRTLEDRIKRGWNIQAALLSRPDKGNRYYKRGKYYEEKTDS